MPHFRKSSYTSNEFYAGHHRFEHWYRDNTVYFLTARCRDRFHAFASEPAKEIFWDRFDHYTAEFGFVPWATTLVDNHYHSLGYMKRGTDLGKMMQRIHGSVAKLVNDLLPQRHLPFWRTAGNQDYFDGCIRDVLQAERALIGTRCCKPNDMAWSRIGASIATRISTSRSSAPSCEL
ncbi:MAG TPA: hypothetical protein VLI90_00960 [Tepidisphaeraceae bacterium]|nr:hypothetical protein [Tepidisphaeraceae bacterium]